VSEEMEAATRGVEYAEIEIMGHRRRIGRISEEERYGVKFLRVDFWDEETDTERTELYTGPSLFSVSPVTEAYVLADIARRKQMREYYESARSKRLAMLAAPVPDDADDSNPHEGDENSFGEEEGPDAEVVTSGWLHMDGDEDD